MKRMMVVLGIGALVGVAMTPVVAENIYINNAGTSGTYGNDTASTLYLRPVNNAMLGPSYFGNGYPQMTQTYYQATGAKSAASGVQAANAYLASTGWTSWQAQREAMLKDRAVLVSRIEELERKVAELEAKMGGR